MVRASLSRSLIKSVTSPPETAMTTKPFNSAVQLLICCTLLLLASASPAAPASGHKKATPATASHLWDVEYILWAPDCQQRVMIGINGEFPGPTIRARAGELLNVTVKNSLHTEGLVIHWHGIKQIGTPWADGTASISQCAIYPGETFSYVFTLDKPGTYFYHGHFGMQRAAGLYGSLIVEATEQFKDPFVYDGELSMLLSDWYHENVYAQAAGLDGRYKHWKWIGEPQTLLINGRGQFGCMLGAVTELHRSIEPDAKTCRRGQGSKDMCQEECLNRGECGPYCPSSQCAPVVFTVEPGKTYRLRVASTTSLSALNVQVEGHKLEVVEADGNHVEPFVVDDVDLYSGDSYSVLLRTDQKPASYWISVGVRGRHPKTVPALAILNYTTGPSGWPEGTPPATPKWDDVERSKNFTYRIRARKETNQPPPPATDRQIAMLNTQNMIAGRVKWSINNVSLSLPPTPYLGAFYYGVEASAFDSAGEAPETFNAGYDIRKPPENKNTTVSSRVYRLRHGSVVDVVLQNANGLEIDVSESHPWHLHGHDFWVLGHGDGRYDNRTDFRRLNTADPPLRNTVVVFPHGWTAIRFVANNTGAWAFHCHIEPHLHMGMGVVFVEGMEKLRKLDVPKEAVTCGAVARMAAVPLTPAMPRPPAPSPSSAP